MLKETAAIEEANLGPRITFKKKEAREKTGLSTDSSSPNSYRS